MRGTLLEKREQPKTSDIAIAATLNTEHDEDGPPLARSFTIEGYAGNLTGTLAPKESKKIGFAAVADGLGGSGARSVVTEVDGKREERTMAYIASRKAQEAAKNVVDKNPQALTGTLEEIRATLQTALEDSYSSINAEAPTSKIKGRIIKEFPTTFSSAVVQETSAGKKVMLFWAGDSPLFVFTPDNIFTTHTPGAGDVPVDSFISPGNYNLKAKQ